MKSRHGGASDVPSDYDPSKYERPSVTADVALFTIFDDDLKILLIRRGRKPCAGMWALPGGFVDMKESLDAAALRELKEETGLDDVYIEQLAAYGDPDRDPRTRVITVAYIALAPFDKLNVIAGDDAADAGWHSAFSPPELAFDHERILKDSLERLQKRIWEAPLVFRFFSRGFTMPELKKCFDTVSRKNVDFEKIREFVSRFGKLTPIEKNDSPARNERDILYKFTPR